MNYYPVKSWSGTLFLLLFGISGLLHSADADYSGERLKDELLDHYRVRLGEVASLRTEIRYEPAYVDGLDLDDTSSDTLIEGKIKITPRLLLMPAPNVNLVFEGRVTDKEYYTDEAGYKEDSTERSFRLGYLLWHLPGGLPMNLQVGRRRFRDDREWLFDENLDALRVHWSAYDWSVDASVSREIFDSEEDVRNRMLFVGRQFKKGRVELFAIQRDDRDSDELARWYGARLRLKPFKGHSLHFDGALRRGDENDGKLGGWGFDAGWKWKLDQSLKPTLFLGVARGSGDDDDDDRDETFRQTGMEDNNGKLTGVDRLSYYGVISDPELSNVSITTLALGIRPKKQLSLELIYHHYQRMERGEKVRFEFEADPVGASNDLGQELNLFLAYKEKWWRANLAVGWFEPGDAYPGGDGSFGWVGEFRYYF